MIVLLLQLSFEYLENISSLQGVSCMCIFCNVMLNTHFVKLISCFSNWLIFHTDRSCARFYFFIPNLYMVIDNLTSVEICIDLKKTKTTNVWWK